MPTPAPPILAPEIHADLQRIVDLMARLVTVPVGLINRRDGDELEVGIAGSDPGNPFAAGRAASWPPRECTARPSSAPGRCCGSPTPCA